MSATSDVVAIPRMTFVGLAVDPFTGIPEMAQTAYGIADELALWGRNYHIRHDEFAAGAVVWRNRQMFTFRIWRKGIKSEVLNPMRYPYKLPNTSWAMKARPKWVRTFLAESPWFFKLMCEIDNNLRGWAQEWGVNLKTLKIAPRWSRHGRLIFKLLPDGELKPRDMLTHYKYET